MTTLAEHRSIVSVHPGGNSLAYVFFEDGRLTDWQTIETNGEGDILGILDRVLDGCAADILVIEDADATGCKRKPEMRLHLKSMAAHARGRGFLVRLVSASDVRLAWRSRGERNKQAVAAALAQHFPELRHLVPPPRKNFMSEDARVHIFNAASLVLHYDQTHPADLLP
jgi:hypothetical protein